MISYKNEWGEEVKIYVEPLPKGVKITFAKKNKADVFCVPIELKQQLVDLINLANQK